MQKRQPTKPAPQPRRVELRGPKSGHLYGVLDRERMIIEVRRSGTTETIDLAAVLRARA